MSYEWYSKKVGEDAFKVCYYGNKSFSFNMSEEHSGAQYYCIVTDKYGQSVQSDTVTIYAGNPLRLTKDLEPSYFIYTNVQMTLSVAAEGDGLKYAWYYKKPGSSTFQSAYHGYPDYSFTMQGIHDGRKYYCEITDKYGVSVTSAIATINGEVSNIEIETQPYDVEVYGNELTATGLRAYSEEELSYHWYVKLPGGSRFEALSDEMKSYMYAYGEFLMFRMNPLIDGAEVSVS